MAGTGSGAATGAPGGGRRAAFFVPMAKPPTTTGTNGKRVGPHGRVYDSERLARVRESMTALIAPHRPSQSLRGALSMDVRWCYPPRGTHRAGEPYALKPDIDNACKLVLDCMQRLGFFEDDRQVAELHVVQAFSDVPGLYVAVSEIGYPKPQVEG